VSYFATQGALLESVTVAGQPGRGRIGVEHGHPAYTIDVELPCGTSRTVVLHLAHRRAAPERTRRHRGANRAAPTPGAPGRVTRDDPFCSWAARGTNIRIDTVRDQKSR
jgi:hypothetical protein